MMKKLTRATLFELVGDGVMNVSMEDLQAIESWRRIQGEVYFDIENRMLMVLQPVEQLGDDLFLTEDGKVLSIGEDDDENVLPEHFILEKDV